MSKLVYICYRDGVNQRLYTTADIRLLSKHLAPDNIQANPPLVIEGKGRLIGIFNPMDVIPIKNLSVCLGQMFGAKEDWWKPAAAAPDGTYALFRSDDDYVEIVSDIVASRTIWYIKTEDMLIASTSQRAIIALLRNHEPNEDVHPWMLSTGTLGPGYSWDKRLKCLKGDARLMLDCKSWKMTIKEEPVIFFPAKLTDKQCQSQLVQAIEDTFNNIHIDSNKWILPLSGGVDSRALLLMLKGQKDMRTITWGVKSSLQNKSGDAYVTRQLSDYFNLKNQFLETDISNESIENIFDRFLKAGEGRTDHISGYMDGFKIWKYLFEESCSGIIRGDQAFGCLVTHEIKQVYKNMNFILLSDYANLNKEITDYYNQQYRPNTLEKRADETQEMWRDRLNMEFEIPTIFAALNDIKLGYIEIINPFFSRRIITQVRQLPDHLRTNKNLFREIVQNIGPRIAYAKQPAIENKRAILRRQNVMSIVLEHLNNKNNILPEIVVNNVFYELARNKNKNRITYGIENITTRLKRKFLKSHSYMSIDPAILAFRAYIISRMREILTEDSYVFK